MISRKTSLLLLAGIAATTSALGQTAPTRDPAQIQAGTYAVDADHMQVTFTVSHLGLSNYAGMVAGVTGTLVLDPKKPAASTLTVKLRTGSVYTPSAYLTGLLKGSDWLDATKYPEMTFVSTKVVPVGADKATVTGDFTLHGVTRPVTLDVTLIGAGNNPMNKKYTVGFEASGKLNRSDFGVKAYVPAIGDELKLKIDGAFERL